MSDFCLIFITTKFSQVQISSSALSFDLLRLHNVKAVQLINDLLAVKSF